MQITSTTFLTLTVLPFVVYGFAACYSNNQGEDLEQFGIQGTIVKEDGTPVNGACVQLFVKAEWKPYLQSPVELVDATLTGEDGAILLSSPRRLTKDSYIVIIGQLYSHGEPSHPIDGNITCENILGAKVFVVPSNFEGTRCT